MPETEFITWLLQADSPSIHYQTLVDLLGLPPNDNRVSTARARLMKTGPVPVLLSRQSKEGKWEGQRSFYTPKYTSSHWSLMLLTELGVNGQDAHFQCGVRYMLEVTAEEVRQRLETKTTGWSCFWGNMLRYSIHAGLADDERVQRIIAYAIMDLQEGMCVCKHNWNSPCSWGVVRTLWGLATLPKENLNNHGQETITQAVNFLLEPFHLLQDRTPAPHGGGPSRLWDKLNFPLFYQADILLALRVLDELGFLDHPGAQPTLDWLEGLRDRNGHWRGSSPFRQRTYPQMNSRSETDRWVSLQTGRILQHAGRVQFAAGTG